MSLDDIRERIRGQAPVLFVDAPAGHGKTFEAINAAVQLVDGLAEHQRVLVLTHTNAARDAFTAALGVPSRRVVFQTLDSFALALVENYGPSLDIAVPVYPGQRGHPSFADIRAKALTLLERAPAIAEAIALRHPVMLVDEHQDTATVQHDLVMRVASARRTRIRFFGDELQAIFDFIEGELINWRELCASGEMLYLSHGYRWDHDPDLRDFLAQARAALLRGEQIDLRKPPAAVHVQRYAGKAPAPGQRRAVPNECANALWALSNCEQLAVLLHTNAHAESVRMRVNHLTLHEGMDPGDPQKLLEAAITSSGDPAKLVSALIDALCRCGSGLDKSRREQINRACQADGIVLGKMTRIAPLTQLIAPLYTQPDIASWLDCLRACCAKANEIKWKPQLRDSLALLTAVRITADDDAAPALYTIAASRRHTMRLAPRIVTTIHKAKGREFNDVALPFVSETDFPDSDAGRRRFYVALTRASRKLHLMIPTGNPSPLVRL